MTETDLSHFDDIRPYNVDEIPAAMKRIASSTAFPLLSSYVFPDEEVCKVREMVSKISSVEEFQHKVMAEMNKQVIARSIDNFTYSGLENLGKDGAYLFVSNHRDIVLDSSLLQYILHLNGFETSEITFGANLMCNQLVIDIGKSNKMFRVERGGNMKEFYQSSLHLSNYIRHVLTQKKQSVWIAQRNGRTKDGIDATDQGIIKMFCMSGDGDKIQALSQLRIIPIAISYEWESCDVLKALELYASKSSRYIKKPGEDLNSIITGITQPKGNVHMEICREITSDDLHIFAGDTLNSYHRHVASLIDSRINANYRLWANNYIAHDIRYGEQRYTQYYTPTQRDKFISVLNSLERFEDCDIDHLKDIFLGIYSNPVNNR